MLGLVEITIELDTSPVGKLTEKWQKARPLGLKYAAEDMTRFLIQNTSEDSPRVVHGVLHSWAIESLDEEQATIRSPAAYAAAQNFGTGPYDIFVSPKSKSALFWGAYDGGKPIMSKGHTIHHPGLKGHHFVEKSFEQLQPLVPGYWMKALEEVD